ncbi:AAA family ATPase [Streptomyces sp. LP05-1]|uniref:AAA family ATPase n=1 Tax=Streptomyces pyxinae TaxID=2970734 RepID=A0ABT2CM17_9ACTN|nr:LuxR family transcriptional regulator [Streptomyces sp. LP05-1]MCS0638486.1 AAA family ATPase [Streptomyces sp. LP05-1]
MGPNSPCPEATSGGGVRTAGPGGSARADPGGPGPATAPAGTNRPAPGTSSGDRAPGDRTGGTASGAVSPLAGRDREEALVTAVLRELRRGRPAVVEVTGPPGIGRSALLDRAAALAARAGVRVAAAQACPEEAGRPYTLADRLYGALARSGHPAAPPPRRGPAELERAALCRLFLAAARTEPLLVVVDDLQWADPASLRWLQALGRRLAGTPLALLTARGDATPAGPGDRITPGPLDDEDTVARHTLALGPLPDPAAGRLLALAWQPPADPAFLAAATRAGEGNPALLRSLVTRFARHGRPPTGEQLPRLADCAAEAVRHRTRHTLGVLPGELHGVLRVIAAAGPGCSRAMITALDGTPAPGALARLAGTGLLLPGDRPAFRHPAAAEAVLAALSVRDREELHARTAAFAHRTAAPDSAVAGMLLGARPIGAAWAAGLLRGEAVRHRAAGRPAQAARLLRRALCEPMPSAQHAEALTELAAAVLPADPETADRHLRQVLLAPAAAGAGPAWIRAAELLVARGDMAAAQPLIARVAGRAAPDDAAALRALYWLAEQSEPEAVQDPDGTQVPPLPARPATAAEAAAAAWRTALRGHHIGLARDLARTALDPAARRAVPLLLQAAACHVLVLSGDHEEARTALDTVLLGTARTDAPPVAGMTLLVMGLAELRRGRPDAASEDLEQAREIMLGHGRNPFLTPGLVALAALVRLEQGRPDAAGELLAPAHPYGTAAGLSGALLLYARGRTRLAYGHREEALTDLLECGRRLLARQVTNPAFLPWRRAAASACDPAADGTMAAALLAEEQGLIRAWGAPGPPDGSLDDGPRPPAPPAARLRRAGPPPDAAPSGSRAVPFELRAVPSGPRSVRSEPRAVPGDRRPAARPEGATPPAPRRQLTGAERRVAALAADGLPNRAIADRLSVTPRTVELHLTRTYRKLGIQGRAELAAALEHRPKATP